jgi:ABC-type ATPase involved in cell division
MSNMTTPLAPYRTSGLDSYTSNEVMTVVKALVRDGTTICATIVSRNSTSCAE